MLARQCMLKITIKTPQGGLFIRCSPRKKILWYLMADQALVQTKHSKGYIQPLINLRPEHRTLQCVTWFLLGQGSNLAGTILLFFGIHMETQPMECLRKTFQLF